MDVRTLPTWQRAKEESFRGHQAVVFDVLRATTTMAYAFAHGARAIRPVDDVDVARRCREQDPLSLLAGEVDFLPPADFDLGNSPTQYTRARVEGRTIILTTTNGTKGLVAVAEAEAVFAAAIVNAAHVADLLAPGYPVVLVAAGTLGRPSVEDLLGAGAVLDRLVKRYERLRLDDWSLLALELWRQVRGNVSDFLLHTANGRRLAEAGFTEDVRMAARTNSLAVVPRLTEREPLTLTAGSGTSEA